MVLNDVHQRTRAYSREYAPPRGYARVV